MRSVLLAKNFDQITIICSLKPSTLKRAVCTTDRICGDIIWQASARTPRWTLFRVQGLPAWRQLLVPTVPAETLTINVFSNHAMEFSRGLVFGHSAGFAGHPGV